MEEQQFGVTSSKCPKERAPGFDQLGASILPPFFFL